MSDFDLETFLPYQLSVLSSRLSREFAAIYREEHGLSVPEWRVLAHLSQQAAVSVREIHARVSMDKSKVSRAAARLEAAGLVAKTRNKDDGRLVSLTLTEKGRGLMDRLAVLAGEYDADLRSRLPEDGAEAFAGAIAHLLERRDG